MKYLSKVGTIPVVTGIIWGSGQTLLIACLAKIMVLFLTISYAGHFKFHRYFYNS